MSFDKAKLGGIHPVVIAAASRAVVLDAPVAAAAAAVGH
jgi:hypothetical protein